MSENPSRHFTATLESEPDSRATFVIMPFDVLQVFGRRGRVPVKGTLNSYPFRGSLAPYGGRHYLGINRALREAAEVAAGEVVDIFLTLDNEPRQVEIPEDFARALQENPAAQAAWERLSYSHRKEYVDAIEEAKKPETRARRIEKAILQLAGESNTGSSGV